MRNLFIVLSCVCVLAASCSSSENTDPKPELKLTANHPAVAVDANGLGVTIAVDQGDESVAIGITTNVDNWTLSEDIPGWIQTIPHEKSLVVNIMENNELEGRSDEFKISVRNESGTVDATVRVLQAGLAAATLELSDDKLEIRPSGGSVKLGIITNQTLVSVHFTEEWLSYSQDSDEVTFTADANDTGATRSAEVNITAGGGNNTSTKKVVISQDATNGGEPGPADDFVGKWKVTGNYYNVDKGGVNEYVHEMYATKVDENTVSFYPVFGYMKLYETIGRDPWHFEDDGETLLVTVNGDGTVTIPFQELTPTWPLYSGMFPGQGMYFAPTIGETDDCWEKSFENIPVNNFTIDLSHDYHPKTPEGVSLAPHRGSYWILLYAKPIRQYFYLEGMFLDIVWTKSTES